METDLVLKNKFSRIALQVSFVFLLSQVFVLFATWRRLPPQVPLFYSRPWGEEQLTSPQGLLLLPSLSITVLLINLLISLLLVEKQNFIRQILSAATAVFSLLCLFTLVQITRRVV